MRTFITRSAAALGVWAFILGGCGGSSGGGTGNTISNWLADPANLVDPAEAGTVISVNSGDPALDPNGLGVTDVTINWGDGTTTSGTGVQTHTYTSGGNYDVTVTVTYTDGTTSTGTTNVAVSPPGPPVITITSLTLKGDTDENATVTIAGNGGAPKSDADPAGTAWESKFNLDGTDLPADPGAGTPITYTFDVNAQDTSGNTAPTKTITIDLQ